MSQPRKKEKTNLIDILARYDATASGEDNILSVSSLTWVPYIDSARVTMYTSHMNQRVVLKETEFPKVYTNYENIVGEYSSYNNKAKRNLEVTKIIKKFSNIEGNGQPYFIFVRDVDTGWRGMIVKKDVENLTEKYGFNYDNSKLNKLKEGDFIKEGDTLTRPTSYDEFDNYGFGKNVKFMYQINNDTIEDAIVVSESLANSMISTEVEIVRVTINDNDFLLNLYGDTEKYKAFPNIGEKIKDKILCAKRRINNKQILFDMKSSNTRRILSSDSRSYIDGEVVDINIFCNKSRDEIADTDFNQQLLEYIDMSEEFYTQMRDYTQELIDSGDECSQEIKVWNKRAKQLIDKNYKIKDENNSVFSNIVMYVLVKRDIGLGKGQKITGRYGNKGVTSKVLPDKLMPRTETGEIIHIIFNTLGVPNRLNIFQLFEQSITFICNRILERVRETDDIDEKADLVFKIVKIFNEEDYEIKYNAYKSKCKTKAAKRKYFEIVEKFGIFIHIKPFWHTKTLWECITDAYKEFPWIKPYKVYFWDEWSERWVKMMTDQIIGDMYVMKLKQNSKKGLSARSTGSINKKGVPEKSDGVKKHHDPYSKTPIRFGIQELINLFISVSPEIVTKEHLLYRASVKGRRSMADYLLSGNIPFIKEGNEIKTMDVDSSMTNRNVEILSAYLNLMGLELVFEHDELDFSDSEGLKEHKYKGGTYIATTEEMKEIVARDVAIRRINEDEDVIYIGSDVQFDTFVDELTEKISVSIEDYLE